VIRRPASSFLHPAAGVRVPAALVAIPLLAGAIAGIVLAENGEPHLPVSAAAAAGLAVLAAAAWTAADSTGEGTLSSIAAAFLAGVSLGALQARAAYAPPLAGWFQQEGASRTDEPVWIVGVLREDAAVTPTGGSMTLDVRVPARGGVRLSIAGSAVAARVAEWRAGRTIRLPALLRRPAGFRDPGQTDEPRALARRGIVLIGSVKSAELIEVAARGSGLSEAAAAARAWTRGALMRHVGRWSEPSGGLAAAVLIGDRSALPDEEERRLQAAGTYHVIAISGGNIAILAGLLFAVLRMSRIPTRGSAVITMAGLVFYGVLAGAPASVTRAVTFAVVFLTARVLDHRSPPLNALGVAAAGAVAWSPLDVLDAGFALSYGATLGILLGARLLAVSPPPGHRGRQRLLRAAARASAGLFVATICAEIALVPLSASLFLRVTFAGLALNFIAIPLMAVVQVASMASLATSPLLPGVADGCGFVAHAASRGIVGSARLVDLAPWLSRDVFQPAWWLCALYYLACAGILASRRHRRTAVAGLALCVAAIVLSPAVAVADRVLPPPRGFLRVAFLDVGQGDATLVVGPGGHPWLIDTGGLPGSTLDVGARVVVPALGAFGASRLDTLVLTHGDPDHIGGAPAVLRRFAPRTIWEGIAVPPHEGLRSLAVLADGLGTVRRTVQAGDVDRVGQLEVHVLHPPPPEWERQRVRNDDSIVLALRLGRVSILLTGDIGGEGERAVARRLPPLDVVVLKAPHHGSATSSGAEFIGATHPSAVVFSAGPGNRFGHPAPAVVDRYRKEGTAIFRTDQDGTVIVDTDGATVEIRTWTGRGMILHP
jgi:competence protein ComEC